MTKQNKRMGRPPKDNNATQVLPPIRVTPEQKQSYKDAAEAKGQKLSAWMKETLDKAVKRIK